MREGVIESAVIGWVNRKIQTFGRVTSLKIDPREKVIAFTAELKGEAQPLEVSMAKYRLIEEDSELFIEITDLKSSRAWIDLAFQEFGKDRRFKLPPSARNAL